MIGFLRVSLFSLVILASLVTGATPSSAADYPNRPVRWLIGFAAGGPVDIVARIMSQWLSERFGQQFVVENRAGSGGNIAAAAARSRRGRAPFRRVIARGPTANCRRSAAPCWK